LDVFQLIFIDHNLIKNKLKLSIMKQPKEMGSLKKIKEMGSIEKVKRKCPVFG
jgi:hypothetical protein